MGIPVPFVTALGLGLLLTPAARRLGAAVGLVDRPAGALKIHARSVPVTGGLAVAGAALAAVAVDGAGPVPAVVGAALLALVIGSADDVFGLPPWARVLGLAGSGVILTFAEPGASLGAAAPAVTVIAALASANAVNVMDGQDGLAAGLALVAALGLAGLAASGGGQMGGTLGLALAGALAAFLAWNFPPARMFLGNGGAYAVGVLLAAGALLGLGDGGWIGLLGAGTCLGVFAFELAHTLARRLLSRARVTAGDREHTYDVLAARVGRTGSSVAMWAVGCAAAGLAFAVRALPPAAGAALVVAGVVAAGAAAEWGLRWIRRRTPASMEGSG